MDQLDEKVEDYFDTTASQLQAKDKSIDELTQHKVSCDQQILDEKRFLYNLQSFSDPNFSPSEKAKESSE